MSNIRNFSSTKIIGPPTGQRNRRCLLSCFGVGNTTDECPKCAGKPWSEEFLSGQIETEGTNPIDLIT